MAAVDILNSDDKDLNRKASLKKMATYRTGGAKYVHHAGGGGAKHGGGGAKSHRK
jgi:hypothetical protein